jgi:hypothetical protein
MSEVRDVKVGQGWVLPGDGLWLVDGLGPGPVAKLARWVPCGSVLVRQETPVPFEALLDGGVWRPGTDAELDAEMQRVQGHGPLDTATAGR